MVRWPTRARREGGPVLTARGSSQHRREAVSSSLGCPANDAGSTSTPGSTQMPRQHERIHRRPLKPRARGQVTFAARTYSLPGGSRWWYGHRGAVTHHEEQMRRRRISLEDMPAASVSRREIRLLRQPVTAASPRRRSRCRSQNIFICTDKPPTSAVEQRLKEDQPNLTFALAEQVPVTRDVAAPGQRYVAQTKGPPDLSPVP